MPKTQIEAEQALQKLGERVREANAEINRAGTERSMETVRKTIIEQHQMEKKEQERAPEPEADKTKQPEPEPDEPDIEP
jgi:hypothetical protein